MAVWTGAGNKADFRIVVTGGQIRELKILAIRISDGEAGETRTVARIYENSQIC